MIKLAPKVGADESGYYHIRKIIDLIDVKEIRYFRDEIEFFRINK